MDPQTPLLWDGLWPSFSCLILSAAAAVGLLSVTISELFCIKAVPNLFAPMLRGARTRSAPHFLSMMNVGTPRTSCL